MELRWRLLESRDAFPKHVPTSSSFTLPPFSSNRANFPWAPKLHFSMDQGRSSIQRAFAKFFFSATVFAHMTNPPPRLYIFLPTFLSFSNPLTLKEKPFPHDKVIDCPPNSTGRGTFPLLGSHRNSDLLRNPPFHLAGLTSPFKTPGAEVLVSSRKWIGVRFLPGNEDYPLLSLRFKRSKRPTQQDASFSPFPPSLTRRLPSPAIKNE